MVKSVWVIEGYYLFKEGLPFYINRVSENFEALEHSHDFVEITYVENGSGFQYIGPDTVRVSKGDLFVLPVGVSHVFRPASSAPGHSLIVSNLLIRPEAVAAGLANVPGFREMRRARRLLQLAPVESRGAAGVSADGCAVDGCGGVNADSVAAAGSATADGTADEFGAVASGVDTEAAEPAWRRFRDRDDKFDGLFRELYREFAQRKTGYELRLYALFVELVVLLERQLDPPDGFAARSSEEAIDKAIRRLERDYAEPLTVAHMTAESGMSERHFNRLFKNATGRTFTGYLQARRIARSCELLAATRQSVQTIAQQCGYQDIKFFQTVFRRIVGTTPGQFRKQAHSEAAAQSAE